MNIQEYKQIVANYERLLAAARKKFAAEVRSDPYWEHADILDISFDDDQCCIEYSHCSLSGCDETNTLHIPVEWLLAAV